MSSDNINKPSSVCENMPPLEELGLLCSSLFLQTYNSPSFECVIDIFEDWLHDSCDVSKVIFCIILFEQLFERKVIFENWQINLPIGVFFFL